MKVQYALAASALALGIAVSAAPAKAATVTDFVTFDIKDAYGQFGVVGYSSLPEATGSFDITFDPSKLYPASGIGSQSVSGAVTFLSLTVTNPDPLLSGLSFNPSDIQYFKYNGGALTLSSDPSTPKTLIDDTYITIGINGFGRLKPAADVWYSLSTLPDAVTSSGGVTGTTPIPGALPLFAGGLGAMGLLGWRRKRRNVTALA
jgi:hypothetical protein